MRTILIIFLIGYFILINLIALALMGIDKRRSIRRKWRIPEKTLFLVAILGGSIGALAGMYLFRHKTKKLRFTIGIPVILVLQILAATFLSMYHREQSQSPSAVVSEELDLVRTLDADTIKNFISYEHLMNTPSALAQAGQETMDAVNLFFKNFQYHLLSEKITGDTATVSVEIINIDMKALAIDVCKALTEKNLSPSPDVHIPKTLNDYYELLKTTLEEHTYGLTASNAYFHLMRNGQSWTIQLDETLQDQLVGGFISWMEDPFLLSPQDVLSIYLDEFKSLSADEWMHYLNIDDIFSTGSDSYAESIDHTYAEKIAEYFSYEITDCTVSDDTASVTLTVTSIDMPNVLEAYKTALLGYARTAESITSDETALTDATAAYLLEALSEHARPAVFPVTVILTNDGHSWQPEIGDELTDAFLGNITEALEAFQGP